MATLAEYQSALDACVASPTPANAAAAAAKHATLPKNLELDRNIATARVDLPDWVKNLAAQFHPGDGTSRIVLARPGYGDTR